MRDWLRRRMERRLDLTDLTIERLAAAAQRAMRNVASSPVPPTVRAYSITVAERISAIRERIRSQAGADGGGDTYLLFSALLSESRSRLEVVVTFLAVLELIKQREIAAEQQKFLARLCCAACYKRQNGMDGRSRIVRIGVIEGEGQKCAVQRGWRRFDTMPAPVLV